MDNPELHDAPHARRILWVPPFLVGAALAISAATGAALLLHSSPGLGRAAAVVASVFVLSLVAGMVAGGIGAGQEVSATPASWWTGLLAALLSAAVFAGVWEATSALGPGFLGRGLGLALTLALPAYCAGGVWSRLGGFANSHGSRAAGSSLIGAALGVAVGAAAVLTFLGRPVRAVTALLAATVLASAGARCQGWLIDRTPSEPRASPSAEASNATSSPEDR